MQKVAQEKEALENQLVLVQKMVEEGEAKAKAEAKRMADEKAEAQRVAQEKEALAKAEAERVAKEKAEAERLSEEKVLAEQLALAVKVSEAKVAKEKIDEAFSLTSLSFKLNSMELTDESQVLLKRTAELMKEHGNFHYEIQGHTDSSGKEKHNVELSQKRADKVKEYLIEQGIDGAILSAQGLGSAQPIATNDTEEGRLKNRRVVFEIVK